MPTDDSVQQNPQSFRDEFRLKNFGLQHHAYEDFCRSQVSNKYIPYSTGLIHSSFYSVAIESNFCLFSSLSLGSGCLLWYWTLHHFLWGRHSLGSHFHLSDDMGLYNVQCGQHYWRHFGHIISLQSREFLWVYNASNSWSYLIHSHKFQPRTASWCNATGLAIGLIWYYRILLDWYFGPSFIPVIRQELPMQIKCISTISSTFRHMECRRFASWWITCWWHSRRVCCMWFTLSGSHWSIWDSRFSTIFVAALICE